MQDMKVACNITISDVPKNIQERLSRVLKTLRNSHTSVDINIFDYSACDDVSIAVQNLKFDHKLDPVVNVFQFLPKDITNHKSNSIYKMRNKYDVFFELNKNVSLFDDIMDLVDFSLFNDENVGCIFCDYIDVNGNLVYHKSMPINSGIIPLVFISVKKYIDSFSSVGADQAEVNLLNKNVSIHLPKPLCMLDK